MLYRRRQRRIDSGERPAETPTKRLARPGRPSTKPVRVTPDPADTTTVPPRVLEAGTVLAARETDSTESGQSIPNGNMTPPRSSTARRAAANEIVILLATTG